MKPNRATRYLMQAVYFLSNAQRWSSLNQGPWRALAAGNAQMCFRMWRYHLRLQQRLAEILDDHAAAEA